MVMKKSGRGSVGRNERRRERYRNDEEFREKRKKYRREYDQKNKEKIQKHYRDWCKKLNEFANKKCLKCNKLLSHKNKSGFCRKHWGEYVRDVWLKRKKK